MTFPRVVLTTGGLAFIALGTAWLVDPNTMGRTARLVIERAGAAVELRAVQGGLRIGVGLFLLVASFRPRWARAALGAMFLILTATAAGRLIGISLSIASDRLQLLYASIELITAAISLVCFRRVKAMLLNSRVTSL
jgi:hypothetical protein